ncbi:MAG: YicC/YloC family endoribonuclease, partial [Alphaproteobacteria bacterium]
MTISSMTGFARAEGQNGDGSWTWEVKSVNSKGLDLRVRIPGGFERLEPPVRDRAQSRFRRGNVTLVLSITGNKGKGGYRINQAVLAELLAVLPEIRKQIPDAETPSIDGLLGLRGVIEPVEEDLTDE